MALINIGTSMGLIRRKLTDKEKKEQEKWEREEEVRKKFEGEIMQWQVDRLYRSHMRYK